MEKLFIYTLVLIIILLIIYFIYKCLVIIYNTLSGNFNSYFLFSFENWFGPLNKFKFWQIKYDKSNIIHWSFVKLFLPFGAILISSIGILMCYALLKILSSVIF